MAYVRGARRSANLDRSSAIPGGFGKNSGGLGRHSNKASIIDEAIYFADKVIATLGVHSECIKFSKIPDDDFAGAKCRSDGDVQHGVHGCLPVYKCPYERGAKHNREGWSAVSAVVRGAVSICLFSGGDIFRVTAYVPGATISRIDDVFVQAPGAAAGTVQDTCVLPGVVSVALPGRAWTSSRGIALVQTVRFYRAHSTG